MFNGDRLRQVRELRGLTQEELAQRVRVSQPLIAQYEAGNKQPSEPTLASISLQTGFPPSFFRRPTVVDFSVGSLLFRAARKMTATDKGIAHQFGRTAYEIANDMAQRLKLPDVRLHRLRVDPISAAQMTRAAFSLSPDTPIPNLVQLVERAGVLVLMLPIDIEDGDAYSTWVGTNDDKPTIVLSGNAPAHRQRLSVAHELAHLVLHPRGTKAQMEVEAWTYGREFLIPRDVMKRKMQPPVTLTKLAAMKTEWGMSMNALLLYADRLRIVTKRQYQALHGQLRERGWDKGEPPNLETPVEKPRAVRKMAELMYGKPIDYQRLATDANLTVQFARQLIEVYASREETAKHDTTDAATNETSTLAGPAAPKISSFRSRSDWDERDRNTR